MSDESASNNEEGYIRTSNHNFISRKATITGTKQVEIRGKTIIHKATIHGDLAVIRIGRYTTIADDSVLKPPTKPGSTTEYVPLLVGTHTTIGSGCDIQAASIGSYCTIGENVKLGPRVIIKDCCVIAAGTEIAADTVVAPFSYMENPKRPELRWIAPAFVELPPSTMNLRQMDAIDRYQDFLRLKA